MSNIADFSQALAQEAKLAQEYVRLSEAATNETYKKRLEELATMSEEKMKLVYQLMQDIPWFGQA